MWAASWDESGCEQCARPSAQRGPGRFSFYVFFGRRHGVTEHTWNQAGAGSAARTHTTHTRDTEPFLASSRDVQARQPSGSWRQLTGLPMPASDSHRSQQQHLRPCSHACVPAPCAGGHANHTDARCIAAAAPTQAFKQAHHPQQCISAVLLSRACVRVCEAHYKVQQEATNGKHACPCKLMYQSPAHRGRNKSGSS